MAAMNGNQISDNTLADEDMVLLQERVNKLSTENAIQSEKIVKMEKELYEMRALREQQTQSQQDLNTLEIERSRLTDSNQHLLTMLSELVCKFRSLERQVKYKVYGSQPGSRGSSRPSSRPHSRMGASAGGDSSETRGGDGAHNKTFESLGDEGLELSQYVADTSLFVGPSLSASEEEVIAQSLTGLQTSIETLLKKSDEPEVSHDVTISAELQAENEQLRDQLAKLTEQISEAKTTNNELTIKVQSLETEHTNSEAEFQHHESEMSDLSEQIETVRGQLAKTEQINYSLQTENDLLNQQVDALKEQLDGADDKENQLIHHNEVMTTEIGESQDLIVRLRTELETLTEDYSELIEKCSVLQKRESLSRSGESKRVENAESQGEKKDLERAELEESQQGTGDESRLSVLDLSEEEQAEDERSKVIQFQKERITNLELELSQIHMELSFHRSMVASRDVTQYHDVPIKDPQDPHAGHSQPIEELSNQLEEALRTIQQLTLNRKLSDEQIDLLNRELEEVRFEKDHLLTNISENLTEIAELKCRLDSMKIKHSAAGAGTPQTEALWSRMREIEEELDNKNSQVRELSRELQHKHVELSSLQSSITNEQEETSQRIIELTEQVKTLEKIVDKYQSKESEDHSTEELYKELIMDKDRQIESHLNTIKHMEEESELIRSETLLTVKEQYQSRIEALEKTLADEQSNYDKLVRESENHREIISVKDEELELYKSAVNKYEEQMALSTGEKAQLQSSEGVLRKETMRLQSTEESMRREIQALKQYTEELNRDFNQIQSLLESRDMEIKQHTLNNDQLQNQTSQLIRKQTELENKVVELKSALTEKISQSIHEQNEDLYENLQTLESQLNEEKAAHQATIDKYGAWLEELEGKHQSHITQVRAECEGQITVLREELEKFISNEIIVERTITEVLSQAELDMTDAESFDRSMKNKIEEYLLHRSNQSNQVDRIEGQSARVLSLSKKHTDDEVNSQRGVIQALKDLLSCVDSSRTRSLSNGLVNGASPVPSADWRASLVNAVYTVFSKEREQYMAQLREALASGRLEASEARILENKINNMARQQDEAMDLMIATDRESLLAEIETLNKEKQLLNDEKQQLAEQSAENEKRRSEMSELTTYKLKQQESMLNSKSKELDMAREKLRLQASDIEMLQGKAHDLNMRLSNSEAERDLAREVLKARDMKIDQLERFSAEDKSNIAQLDTQLKLCKQREVDIRSQLEKTIRQRDDDNERAQNNSRAAQLDIDALKDQLTSAHVTREKEILENQAEKAQLAKQIDDITTDVYRQRQRIEQLTQDVAAETAQRIDLKKQLGAETALVSELRTQVVELERRPTEEDYDNINEELETEKSTTIDLTAAVERAKNRAANLSAALDMERAQNMDRLEKDKAAQLMLKRDNDQRDQIINEMEQMSQTERAKSASLRQDLANLSSDLASARKLSREAESKSNITADQLALELEARNRLEELVKLQAEKLADMEQLIADKEKIIVSLHRDKIRRGSTRHDDTFESARSTFSPGHVTSSPATRDQLAALTTRLQTVAGRLSDTSENTHHDVSDIIRQLSSIRHTLHPDSTSPLTRRSYSPTHADTNYRSYSPTRDAVSRVGSHSLSKYWQQAISDLYSRCRKAESRVRGLIYQKNLILKQLGGYEETEAEVLSRLASMGALRDRPLHRVPPLRKFKAAVRSVVAVLRMRWLLKRSKRLNSEGANEILKGDRHRRPRAASALPRTVSKLATHTSESAKPSNQNQAQSDTSAPPRRGSLDSTSSYANPHEVACGNQATKERGAPLKQISSNTKTGRQSLTPPTNANGHSPTHDDSAAQQIDRLERLQEKLSQIHQDGMHS